MVFKINLTRGSSGELCAVEVQLGVVHHVIMLRIDLDRSRFALVRRWSGSCRRGLGRQLSLRLLVGLLLLLILGAAAVRLLLGGSILLLSPICLMSSVLLLVHLSQVPSAQGSFSFTTFEF